MCKRGYCRSGARLGPCVQDIAGMMMQESRGPAGMSNIGGATGRSTKIGPNAEDQALKCPRCDSPNTKFCYYNNYNLTQPRHFCKTCRRYWTKGGALRNVPVGGGCRKNKRPKQRSADRTPLPIALDHRHRHRHLNPNPQHRGEEESPSPAAVALLQNLWGTSSNSNFPDLGPPAVPARLQNRPNLLSPAAAIQHGHMAYENPSAILSNLGFALPEPNFGSGAEDILQWRIQQQARLTAALQQQNLTDPNTDSNPSHNHSNATDNNNNIDLMPISPADHHQLLLQQQQKGKSIVSGDLQADWPAMADCLFEPQPVESTSGYWYNDGFAELAGLQCVAGIDGGHLQRNRCTQ